MTKIKDLDSVGFPMYRIDECGNVYSQKTGKMLSPCLDKRGYPRVNVRTLDGKSRTMPVHRLCAMAFVPNPENKPQVDHIDGNKTNNHASNLRWATNLENVHYAMETGLMPHAVITDDNQVHQVCQLIAAGVLVPEIERITGVPYTTIWSIKLRRNWTHISSKYEFPETNPPKYTDKETVTELCRLIKYTDMSNADIACKLNVNTTTVSRTRSGRIYKKEFSQV